MPGISTRGITKRFGPVTALTGVDLDVAPGEIVTLLGPNGAGKSTLMRILATLVLPDTGTAWIHDSDVVTQASAARQSLGLALADDRSWYWRLTGRQNLAFFAALHALPRRMIPVRINDVLADVGLTDAADRRFDQYSTGMRARLTLARALLPSPPVLLLDEPTRSLDPVAAAGFRRQVSRLVAERRLAVLFATHDLHEASTIANRILILASGRVVQDLPGGTAVVELEQNLLGALGQ